MKKVSIIIPNYNYLKYLPQRLDSVFKQTFTDYEVILLDDSSTDGSAEYLREQAICHPQVTHCVLNKKNTGNPFMQWEKGISLSKGEYIWIAESDDYCKPDFLEKMVSILDANPDASYVMSGSHLVDSLDNPIPYDFDKCSPKYKEDGCAYKYLSATYLKHFLLWYNAAYNASMIVFRRDCLDKIQMDFCSTRYCGDWLFWIKLTEVGNVIVLHERLNYFRRHQKSVTFISDRGEKQMDEKLLIFSYLWKHHHFGWYRDNLSRGYVYKEILRARMSESKKKECITQIKRLGANRLLYSLERVVKVLSQILPFIPAPKRDYVEGVKLTR